MILNSYDIKDTILPADQLNHLYIRKYIDSNVWQVIEKHGGVLGDFEEVDGRLVGAEPHIIMEFDKFKEGRPEYIRGQYVDVNQDIDELYNTYNLLLAGAVLKQDDKVLNRVRSCISWLQGTDFNRAPGSTMYHDAEIGGLLRHTLRTYNKVIELLHMPSYRDVSVNEAIVVALVHDWCKIDKYEQYLRNVKNEQTEVWEKVPSFRWKTGGGIELPHGTASLYLAMKLLPISPEQAYAITWHMGKWRCHDADTNDMQYANEHYPMVHLIQFADQLAITNY